MPQFLVIAVSTLGCLLHLVQRHDITLIGVGNTAVVELLPSGHVRKSPHPQASQHDRECQIRQLTREVDIYSRLPSHNRLIRMVSHSTTPDDAHIVLEYMPQGTLGSHLASHADIPACRRLKWSMEAAEAVVLLHTHGIIHSDIKPANMLLGEGLGLRLIDTSGSSIDGGRPLCLESTRFFMPRDTRAATLCSVSTDLFALGSTLYNIVTGAQPYADVDDDEVEARFERQEFPATDRVLCGDVIRSCWMGRFQSAQNVLDALAVEAGHSSKRVSA